MQQLFLALALVAALSSPAWAVDFDGYHPDPAMTPGAVYSQDRSVICANSNANRPREGVESLRPRIFTAYGIPRSQWHLYQLDHLIDRGVGGADSVANLYPERLAGPRGALVKDRQCDTRAWRMLCKDGSITVAQAQAVFQNWEVECPRVLHGVLPKVP